MPSLKMVTGVLHEYPFGPTLKDKVRELCKIFYYPFDESLEGDFLEDFFETAVFDINEKHGKNFIILEGSLYENELKAIHEDPTFYVASKINAVDGGIEYTGRYDSSVETIIPLLEAAVRKKGWNNE